LPAVPAVPRNRLATAAAVTAAVFGLLSIAAGGRVLFGADPGYVVYRPLLWFNVTMGFVYVAVGVLALTRLWLAALGAVGIAVLNCLVLAGVAALRASGVVAGESVQAMVFRTMVWFILAGMLSAAGRAGAPKR
jgi:hypothetical protein